MEFFCYKYIICYLLAIKFTNSKGFRIPHSTQNNYHKIQISFPRYCFCSSHFLFKIYDMDYGIYGLNILWPFQNSKRKNVFSNCKETVGHNEYTKVINFFFFTKVIFHTQYIKCHHKQLSRGG